MTDSHIRGVVITNKDLTLLYITAYEGSGGWRRNTEATDRAMRKIMKDIVEREIFAARQRREGVTA